MDGMKVKAIRYFFGESMSVFSKRVGVGATTICAIENGQREISDYVRAKLVRIEAGLSDDFYIFYTHFRKIS
ncbi:hypothetical protein [Bacillus mesophilum]|uniref:HTH cro/C1-type domain-containing protein n=1 Tax=Bacillus mesophilum TaxID=1071718 RepID=A0A7V7RMZ6_9BACI|nr:hypothetical protein [Bacillus mesophilum]KAB2332928.1 hypothetical protein F7732_12670 [Bacillus mesophilum]